jgi:hypothetical protein
MCLDGDIACPDDELGNSSGDGFDRLHGWSVTPQQGEILRSSGRSGELVDAIDATGEGNDLYG